MQSAFIIGYLGIQTKIGLSSNYGLDHKQIGASEMSDFVSGLSLTTGSGSLLSKWLHRLESFKLFSRCTKNLGAEQHFS